MNKFLVDKFLIINEFGKCNFVKICFIVINYIMICDGKIVLIKNGMDLNIIRINLINIKIFNGLNIIFYKFRFFFCFEE